MHISIGHVAISISFSSRSGSTQRLGLDVENCRQQHILCLLPAAHSCHEHEGTTRPCQARVTSAPGLALEISPALSPIKQHHAFGICCDGGRLIRRSQSRSSQQRAEALSTKGRSRPGPQTRQCATRSPLDYCTIDVVTMSLRRDME